MPSAFLICCGEDGGGGGRGGVQVEDGEAEIGVSMETIVFPSPVIGAAGVSKYVLFLSLFNTSDTSAVTGHTHTHTH